MYNFYRKKLVQPPGYTSKILLIMKLTTLLLIVSIMQVSAVSFAQRVTLSKKDAALIDVLTQIRKQTGYGFIFNSSTLKDANRVTIDVKDAELNDVLNGIFKEQPLIFAIEGKSVVVSKKEQPSFLERIIDRFNRVDIRGRVVGSDGAPVSGATVTVKGTKQSNVTDQNGLFSFSGVDDNAVLVITYIGYKTKEISAKANLGDVVLEVSDNPLDEVQVIAYGTTSRRLSTGNVSTVKADVIAKQAVSNPLAALSGRVPGLVITENSGIPGSGFKVQVRGQNSLINGSEPFFIIDGVPFAPNNQPVSNVNSVLQSYGGSNNGISPFNSLNPADIESIEVLKDADATAIYGSRGANGVILITTKKGVAGKLQFNANAYQGFSELTRAAESMNTMQYVQMRKTAFSNDNVVPTMTNAYDLLNFDTTSYTNFDKLLTGNTAKTTDAYTSVSGGNSATRYFIGTGFRRETSIYPTEQANTRFSVKGDINHTSTDKRFSIGFTTSYSNGINKLPYTFPTSLLPNTPDLYKSDGSLNWGAPGATFENPLSYLKKEYEAVTDNLLSNLNVQYKLINDLSFKTSIGYNLIKTSEEMVEPNASLNPNTSGVTASSTFSNGGNKNLIIEPQLDFDHRYSFGALHVLAGATYQYNERNSVNVMGTGYSNDALIHSLDAAASVSTKSSAFSQYKYAAVFGRINYNFQEKYLLNFTARRDGSSKFGPNKQYANFGAVGAGWIFTNERLFKEHVKFLSFGKLRGSYGVSGNDQIGDYKFLDTWIGLSPYQNMPSLVANALYNPDYNWERTRKLELAMDYGLFNDRVIGTFSYYRNRSDNQLVSYKLPTQTGFSSVLMNLPALIQNSGWEISLEGQVFNKDHFKWNISGSLTVPINKLVSFPGLASSSYATIYEEGKPVTAFKGYTSLGVDPNTGIYKFQDKTGDNVLSAADLSVLGNIGMKYYGGIRNVIQYKGIEIDIFFEGRKQTGFNYLNSVYRTNNSTPGFMYNQSVYADNYWKTPGQITDIQKVTQSTSGEAYQQIRYIKASSAVLGDASFIRLKTLAVSYNVANLFKNLAGRNLKVTLQGQNLLLFTGYKYGDPETQNLITVPPLRTMTIGFQTNL